MTITLVSASAGTGKTYRLGSALLEAVHAEVPPQSVLATTFTNRAAAELLARGRSRLLDGGLPNAALNLMLARVGTVNSVFGRIVSDFALHNGRSPVVSVIPEGALNTMFRTAADDSIQRHGPVLTPIAERFGFFVAGADWQTMLTELVAAARANGISHECLSDSASRSLRSLMAALPSRASSGPTMDAALLAAVQQAAVDIKRSGDVTKKTAEALAELEVITARLERGTATWADWAKLSKAEAAKASNRFLDPVRDVAALHPEHPRLHDDIETFIGTMFAAAGEAMEMVQQYKRRQGLVDFVDQESEALSLLSDPDAVRRLSDETKMLLVDEFQDTSPIQLALFLRLAAFVDDTLFVGDTKQAVYGFRGADPGLVDAVAVALNGREGVKTETLPTNRRSRPAIVAFVNAVFGTALPPLGIPKNQVVVEPHRNDLPGQPPALALWRIHGANKDAAWTALAQRVARVLQDRESWPVQPPGENMLRPIRGGDIAVLVRTNDNAAQIADALADVGLRVALARSGLLSRAECALAIAGLRFIADASDTLALAEIAHIFEGDVASPSWLAQALLSADPVATLRASPIAAALAAERSVIDALTPAEMLDRAISVLDLHGALACWGDPAARHANLEALRAMAREFESECQRTRLPATASALAAWLTAQPKADQPPSPDPDAVQILTCHGSKGLEWPMVILAELDNPGEPRLFNRPIAMPRDGGLDISAPLEGRWVRLWPWPYGKQKANVGLDTTAVATPEGVAAKAAAEAEAGRLLYVAMTRARDYLVLAPRRRSATALSATWLDILRGEPRPLELPPVGSTVLAAGEPIEMPTEDLVAAELDTPDRAQGVRSLVPDGEPPIFPPRRITPSASVGGPTPKWRVIPLGDRLPLHGASDMGALGEALHGFFAADRPKAAPAWRQGLAERLLSAWGVSALRPEDAMLAADRFWQYLDVEHAGSRWRREWPVIRTAGGQMLSGRLDLVVEMPQSLAIYDHKSFPGGRERWADEVAVHAPQLRAYVDALGAASGLPIARTALHLPIAGVLLDLEWQ